MNSPSVQGDYDLLPGQNARALQDDPDEQLNLANSLPMKQRNNSIVSPSKSKVLGDIRAKRGSVNIISPN